MVSVNNIDESIAKHKFCVYLLAESMDLTSFWMVLMRYVCGMDQSPNPTSIAFLSKCLRKCWGDLLALSRHNKAVPRLLAVVGDPIDDNVAGFLGSTGRISIGREVSLSLSFPRRTGSVRVCAAKRDATQRVVITGMGVASCFGNDPDVFYSKWVVGDRSNRVTNSLCL